MSNWIDSAETALENLNRETNIPYDFERWLARDNEDYPNTYIVYFIVSQPGISSADNKERLSQVRIQVSLFCRDIITIKSIPDKIIKSFEAQGFRRSNIGRVPYQTNTGHFGWRCEFTILEKRS